MIEQSDNHTENLNIVGRLDAPVVVVCDAPSHAVWERGLAMSAQAMTKFADVAMEVGMEKSDFVFITPCAPMPDTVLGSASREGKFLAEYTEEFRQAMTKFTDPKLIVFTGATAGKQLMERSIKITQVRGRIQSREGLPPILPMFSPGHVNKRTELLDTFKADMRTLGFLKDHDYRVGVIDEQADKHNYQWVTDLSFLLANKPRVVCVDTEYETEGRRWYEGVELLTIQLSIKEGESFVVPLSCRYYPGLTQRQRGTLIRQLRELLDDESVAVTGHNFKSDLHVLRQNGIEVANWNTETVQLCFVVDDNMKDKGLDEATRQHIPELAGYADAFNNAYDKNYMSRVPLDAMVKYGGGDTDAGLRLAKKLTGMGMQDERNWNCYRRIQMPALRTFFEMEEIGIRVNEAELDQLGVVLGETQRETYASLMERVPAAVRRRHLDKGLSFTRRDFVADILFSPDGFNLKPTVFTKGTRKLPPDQRVPSTSTKEHLPFFDDNTWVQEFIAYQKLVKMQSTYAGRKAWTEVKTNRKGDTKEIDHEDTGFWKYIFNERIHPTFDLHVTTTGRSNSRDPNAQNFPKRGKLAKAFRKIFVPTPGWVLIECDLSQAELRIAAWMAQEPTMMEVYRQGGDIHATTAAAIMGISIEQFNALDDDTKKLKRFQAKAVNFGFLYGMGWRKFLAYAKTDYGITFTEEEAQDIREKFFQKYSRLPRWHTAMRDFVNKHGYVRALHGALRRLPSIRSSDEGTRGECERQAINSPVQRFASDLGLMGMARFGRDCDWSIMRPLAFIHDAVVIEARIGHEEEAMSAIKFYMQSNPLEEWFGISAPIPIVADVSISHTNLAEMEERPDVAAVAPNFYQQALDTEDAPQQLYIHCSV